MPTSIFAPQNKFLARPIRSALIPQEGPKTIAFDVPFSLAVDTTYEIDLSTMFLAKDITIVQSIYMENAGNDAVTVYVPSTGQSITYAAGMAGYLPLLSPVTPVIWFTSNRTTDLRVQLMNVPVPASVWNSTGLGNVTITGDVDVVNGSTPFVVESITDPVSVGPAVDTAIWGRIGNITLTDANTPVVTNGAYAANEVVGGLLTLTALARVGVGSGTIQAINIVCMSTQTAPLDVIFFNANPTASTFTDNNAPVLNAADADKVIGVVNLAGPTSVGTPVIYPGLNIALPFLLPSGVDIFAVIIVRAAWTLTSTSDIHVLTSVIAD